MWSGNYIEILQIQYDINVISRRNDDVCSPRQFNIEITSNKK